MSSTSVRSCGTDKRLLEHFADPEIANNLLAIPFPYTEADADWWLDRCEQSIGSPMTNFALHAFRLPLVPSGWSEHRRRMPGSTEFGWLAQSYRGRGLMPSRHPHIQRLRISRAPNSSACLRCSPRILLLHRAPGEGRFSARRATQASSPQGKAFTSMPLSMDAFLTPMETPNRRSPTAPLQK